jgi:hypothetical protein
MRFCVERCIYASAVITGVGFDEGKPLGLEVSCVAHFASRHLCLFGSRSLATKLLYGLGVPGAGRFERRVQAVYSDGQSEG